MSDTFTCKDWTLDYLLGLSQNFHPVPRVSALGPATDVQAAIDNYEATGVPLIIDGLHEHEKWPREQFDVDWLRRHWRDEEGRSVRDIPVRNVHTRTDKKVSVSKFIEKARSASFFQPGETERLYGKDAKCPPEYSSWMHDSGVLPSRLLPRHPNNLLCNLPEQNHVETLMCYLGVGDTYTPCHKDLCASSGNNIMCYTENNGSSFWFMTETSASRQVSEYFHQLDQELDHESHFITLKELSKAPFKVFVAQQSLGDMVLVPPRSCHQVVNYGGITLKTAWSRMTLKGLSLALHYELAIYRRVCRPETYRIKSIIHYALKQYTQRVLEYSYPAKSKDTKPEMQVDIQTNPEAFISDMETLLELYDHVLVQERCQPDEEITVVSGDGANEPHLYTCDYCGADIFQSFFECRECVNTSPEDVVTICPGCYAEGRSCQCTDMMPRQRRPFYQLEADRKEADAALELAYKATKLSRRPKETNKTKEAFAEIFQAACILKKFRVKFAGTRKCAPITPREASHEVLGAWSLNCKKCHKAKCYPHMLQYMRIHSVEAMISYYQNDTHEVYHSHHRISKSEYEEHIQQLQEAEAKGAVPDINVYLAYIALEFVASRPLRASLLQEGWYDSEDIAAHAKNQIESLLQAHQAESASSARPSGLRPSVGERKAPKEQSPDEIDFSTSRKSASAKDNKQQNAKAPLPGKRSRNDSPVEQKAKRSGRGHVHKSPEESEESSEEEEPVQRRSARKSGISAPSLARKPKQQRRSSPTFSVPLAMTQPGIGLRTSSGKKASRTAALSDSEDDTPPAKKPRRQGDHKADSSRPSLPSSSKPRGAMGSADLPRQIADAYNMAARNEASRAYPSPASAPQASQQTLSTLPENGHVNLFAVISELSQEFMSLKHRVQAVEQRQGAILEYCQASRTDNELVPLLTELSREVSLLRQRVAELEHQRAYNGSPIPQERISSGSENFSRGPEMQAGPSRLPPKYKGLPPRDERQRSSHSPAPLPSRSYSKRLPDPLPSEQPLKKARLSNGSAYDHSMDEEDRMLYGDTNGSDVRVKHSESQMRTSRGANDDVDGNGHNSDDNLVVYG